VLVFPFDDKGIVFGQARLLEADAVEVFFL